MSRQVRLPKSLWGIPTGRLARRFGLAETDVLSVTTSPNDCITELRDGVTLPFSTEEEREAHPFARLTAAQAEQWIENNVTNLASAKQALKLLAKFCIYLRDQD